MPLRPAHWLFLLRLAALVALATSAALLADYVAAEPSFCGAGTGCAHVRASEFAHLKLPGLPVLPLPLLGVVGFSLVLGASLLPDARRRARITVPLAGLLAAAGLGLIVLQVFVIGHVCAFCVVVDLCALAIGGAAVGLRGEGWDESTREELTDTYIVDSAQLVAESQRLRGVWREDSRVYTPPNPLIAPGSFGPPRLRTWAWAALSALAVLAPLSWSELRPKPPVPSVIRGLYEPGKINVVEFADFQCPHCRELHGRLKQVLAEYGDRVHFQRRHVPLPMHPQAEAAARAALCAEAQGQGEPMADRLFSATDLRPRAIQGMARDLKLDLPSFDACLASPETERRIAGDIELLREAGFEGLPTTYVGSRPILGAEGSEVFLAALDAAQQGDEDSGLSGWIFALACLLIVAALVFWGRVLPRVAPERLSTPPSRRATSRPRLDVSSSTRR